MSNIHHHMAGHFKENERPCSCDHNIVMGKIEEGLIPKTFYNSSNFVGECFSRAADTHLALDYTSHVMQITCLPMLINPVLTYMPAHEEHSFLA